MNAELKEYIVRNIFPLYKQIDEGHNLENHINYFLLSVIPKTVFVIMLIWIIIYKI